MYHHHVSLVIIMIHSVAPIINQIQLQKIHVPHHPQVILGVVKKMKNTEEIYKNFLFIAILVLPIKGRVKINLDFS